MKINEYLKNNQFHYFENLLLILDNNRIDEDKINIIFPYVKKIGSALGLKVKRSDTMFTYIKRAEEDLSDLYTYATLYIFANNSKQKKELYDEMAKIIKKISPQKISAFFINLDKLTFGLSSKVRAVLNGLFGIEISTYNKWVDEIDYLKKEIIDIRKVLYKIDADKTIHNILNDFEKKINKIQITEETGVSGISGGEVGIGIANPTLTKNIAKYEPKLTKSPIRRKKKIKLKNLIK